MPWYDFVWRKNPLLLRLMPGFRMAPIVPFAISQIQEREQKLQHASSNKSTGDDILDRFISARESDPTVPGW